jgi:hypothetical protein
METMQPSTTADRLAPIGDAEQDSGYLACYPKISRRLRKIRDDDQYCNALAWSWYYWPWACRLADQTGTCPIGIVVFWSIGKCTRNFGRWAARRGPYRDAMEFIDHEASLGLRAFSKTRRDDGLDWCLQDVPDVGLARMLVAGFTRPEIAHHRKTSLRSVVRACTRLRQWIENRA